jgi:hypothetical protein
MVIITSAHHQNKTIGKMPSCIKSAFIRNVLLTVKSNFVALPKNSANKHRTLPFVFINTAIMLARSYLAVWQILLVSLATTTTTTTRAVVVENGSYKVDVTMESTDNFGSNKKCVEYLSGAPEKYTKACFTSKITDGGNFIECAVNFDSHVCDSCAPCKTNEDLAGYTLDCFSYLTRVNTNLLCVELTNTTIQTVLTGTDFKDIPFNFTAGEVTSSANGSINGTGGAVTADKTSSTSRLAYFYPSSWLLSGAVVLLQCLVA